MVIKSIRFFYNIFEAWNEKTNNRQLIAIHVAETYSHQTFLFTKEDAKE